MLYTNIGQLAWSTGGNRPQTKTIENAWLHIEGGKIAGFGSGEAPVAQSSETKDCSGLLLTPALTDCHTHLVFAGSRANEFCDRLSGKTYQQIAAAGGGILSTVEATRSACETQLLETAKTRLAGFEKRGVTTIEIKSGYGLGIDAELKMLRVISKLKAESKLKIFSTCLALHAVPKDKSKSEYIKECTDKLLPIVAKEKLADFVDVFLENGYFSESDADEFMAAAKALGIKVKVHADEFADSGGAQAAANWRAVSADHLQAASSEGLQQMAEKNVVAVLLPGTSLYTKIPFADAGKMRAAGLTIAVGSDYNPGSCGISNLAFLASMAGIHCGLTPEEVFASVTTNAQIALGMDPTNAVVTHGNALDFCLWPMQSWQEWVADAGQSRPL